MTLSDYPRAFPNVIEMRGRPLVDAVHYMHGKGIVHMDIKADNIFIGADKSWVLGDFGSSKNRGDIVTTSNLVHFVHFPLYFAEPKYDYFMLLLVFLKESLEKKRSWIEVLCDGDEKYDPQKKDNCIRGMTTPGLQSMCVQLQTLAKASTELP